MKNKNLDLLLKLHQDKLKRIEVLKIESDLIEKHILEEVNLSLQINKTISELSEIGFESYVNKSLDGISNVRKTKRIGKDWRINGISFEFTYYEKRMCLYIPIKFDCIGEIDLLIIDKLCVYVYTSKYCQSLVKYVDNLNEFIDYLTAIKDESVEGLKIGIYKEEK